MKLLFVGQAPSAETEGKPPFSGKCGAFLAKLLGTTQEEMLEAYEFRNILNFFPGKGIGGDKFPMSLAIVEGKKLLKEIEGRSVILLGSNVARAFGIKQFSYGEKYEVRDPDTSKLILPLVCVVPHPSQRNRTWNDPKTATAVAGFLRDLVKNYQE